MKRDSVSAYVHMRRNTPLPLYAQVHILDEPPSFPQLCKYIMDGLPLKQKTKKNHSNIVFNEISLFEIGNLCEKTNGILR